MVRNDYVRYPKSRSWQTRKRLYGPSGMKNKRVSAQINLLSDKKTPKSAKKPLLSARKSLISARKPKPKVSFSSRVKRNVKMFNKLKSRIGVAGESPYKTTYGVVEKNLRNLYKNSPYVRKRKRLKNVSAMAATGEAGRSFKKSPLMSDPVYSITKRISRSSNPLRRTAMSVYGIKSVSGSVPSSPVSYSRQNVHNTRYYRIGGKGGSGIRSVMLSRRTGGGFKRKF